MKLTRTIVAASLATLGLLAGAATASAQSGTATPGLTSRPGSSAPTPSFSRQRGNDDLDLPVSPPDRETLLPTRPESADDPSDEPPPTIYGEEITSENDTIFYVVDFSGSMRRDRQSFTTPAGTVRQGARIDRAKAELTRSIQGLSPNFRFNIVSYNCNTRTWQGGMVEADEANKQAAIAWIDSQRASGGTATGPATALGLAEAENMAVVLLTDGRPNCGADGYEGHRQTIRIANVQGAVINVFGIAASGDYRAFCQAVAADSGGTFVDVP